MREKGRQNQMLYDKDIREPLFEFLEEQYGEMRILEEKQMGRSRADVVMVLPEAVVGIEIKSDADTYARLSRQIKDYNQFFDYNYVVVGSSHGCHIEEHVPLWWGIITVEIVREPDGDKIDFYMLRKARKNPAKSQKRMLSLLWRPELAHIQEINGMARYREKSKAFVIDKILEKIPENALARQISEELFQRDYTEIDQRIKEYRGQRGRF